MAKRRKSLSGTVVLPFRYKGKNYIVGDTFKADSETILNIFINKKRVKK